MALEAVETALRPGSSKTALKLELAKRLRSLEKTFTDLAVRHELAQKPLSQRPTRLGER